MYVVGVTGGIGSGKTTVTRLFEQLGVVVVDADVIARHIMDRGSPAMQAVQQRYGDQALHTDGSLNRAWLRAHIFAHPEEKAWLNQLTHPLIREQILAQLQAAKSSYVILSAPLLIENGLQQFCQRVLVVDVDEATQCHRTANRDNVSSQQVKAVMAAQVSREKRLEHADDIIDNRGDVGNLQPQVQQLHQLYLRLASQ